MKKPRKSRPKANERRAPVATAALSRAVALAPSPAQLEDIFHSIRRSTERRLDGVTAFARRITQNELAPRLRRLHDPLRTVI